MTRTDACARGLTFLVDQVGLAPVLADAALTDLFINGPDRAFVQRGRGKERIPFGCSLADLEDIAILAAAMNNGGDVADDTPLATGRLPGGERVQIAQYPAVEEGTLSLSVRKPKMVVPTPDGLDAAGTFSGTMGRHRPVPHFRAELDRLYAAREWRAFLSAAVGHGLNVVWTGMVGTGKTHCQRAFTADVRQGSRIVTVQDTHELVGLPHDDVVNLFYAKGGQGVANTSAEACVEAALRMGMDYLLVQELRDQAAYGYLNVLESGHSGMTTVHADSAEDAFDRIRMLVKKHPQGQHLADQDVNASLYRSIDVVAHCVKEGDRRRVAQVFYDPALKEKHANADLRISTLEDA